MMLHVTDNRVLPFQEIDCAIRTNLDIRRAKVLIVRLHDRLDFSAEKAGVGIGDLILQDAKETDDVGDEQISLHGIGKLAAGKYLHAGAGARALVVEFGRALVSLWEIGFSRKAGPDVRLCTRAIHDKILAPAVENVAVRIGKIVCDVCFELMRARLISINGGVHVPRRRAVGRLDLRGMEDAFLKIEGATRIQHEAVGCMMCVR